MTLALCPEHVVMVHPSEAGDWQTRWHVTLDCRQACVCPIALFCSLPNLRSASHLVFMLSRPHFCTVAFLVCFL